ncbi:hypothetical protein [Streptomyces sp. NPDC059122]|uniref:hypothetical protein n=1 Tax=Streptomyces sp. NPDC059122 TaxID=3346732 RepID=UPI00367458B9
MVVAGKGELVSKVRRIVLGTAVAGLVTGCAGAPAVKPRPSGASKPTASPSPKRDLPEGMHKLGEGVSTQDGKWALKPSALTEVAATANAKRLPRGWHTAKMTWTLTNKTGEIQPLLDVSPTVRYGAMGRAAAVFTDTGIDGIPDGSNDDAPRVKPGGSYTVTVGVAVPAEAAGDPVTITVLPSTMVGDSGDVDFFEGPFPGAAHKGVALHPRPAPETTKSLAFGQWKADQQLSVGNLRAEGSGDDGRPMYGGDLTVFNDATDASGPPYTPMKTTVRVYYGNQLKEADLVQSLVPSASETAFIAPQRAATHHFRFALPKGATPGTVTVEVTDLGTALATFEGEITSPAS